MDRSTLLKASELLLPRRVTQTFPFSVPRLRPSRRLIPTISSPARLRSSSKTTPRRLKPIPAGAQCCTNPIGASTNIVRHSRPQSADLKLQRRILSDGTECRLPIRYFDVQCLVATFLTGLDRAAGLLKGTGLQALSQEHGKGVVLLYCIEYRVTDIGPYNEVGLTVVATAPGDPIPANYVLDLPVTTAVARRTGREIWGYNKFLAAIDVGSNGKRFSTIVRDSDRRNHRDVRGRPRRFHSNGADRHTHVHDV